MRLSKGRSKHYKWYGFAAALIIAAAVLFVFFLNPQRTFIITETYRIMAVNGSETYLHVILPVSGAYQEITGFSVAGADDYSVENHGCRDELTAKVFSDGSEKVVTVTYTAKLFRYVKPWDGDVLDEYTLPQQWVDSDNGDIIRLGEELRGRNDYRTARNIIRYANKTIRGVTGNQANTSRFSASELLVRRMGVCGDYAALMTALLRAEGIPARMISGLSLRIPLKNAADWSHRGVAHAWVEFYADGKWHFADPTWGWFNRNGTAHLSYGAYETDIRSDFQQNRLATAEPGFYIRGAMTAPLMFTIYSTDENAVVIPRADTRYSWFW
ncbi:MAG: hypothetical protein FWE91_12185 [Defluviitaleaceae bacterium]|nr:hypothetical protein [Defluviitaleaceae bacterium]MCL2836510.1 hypothetical protein [Defluviitaleaceae bacterium]